jgi:serine phosphatase RsbU (regulator of sigma subunit)/outer membrane protein assembly factor BamD (BamD/ComL family)
MAGFNSILKFLNDITRITREIVHGANVSGFSIIPLSKEFAAPEYALLSMTRSIDDKRKTLENELQERSAELERVLKDIKTRNEIIREQADKVKAIRKNILPAEIDGWNELKFSVKYNAMEKIGGDFYDIFHLNDNKIGILIGDVSCHGVPAALIAAMAKISFNSAMHNYDSPKRIFQEVNKNIIDILQGDDYMSCFMAVIDDEYNVTYSNAGHQKGIIFRKEIEGIELIDTEGLFIGSLEDAIDSYEEKTTKLNSGDRLILYTDGIPEAQNRSGEKYSNKRMERFIIKNKDMPLEDFTEAMLRDVHEYAEGNDSADDMSLLAVELAADEAIEIINSSLKLIDKNKYLDAAELLENGLGRHPNNLKIIYNLGKVYFRINNYEKSIHLFDRYLKRDKKNKYAFYVNGASHYQMMNYKEAAENFKAAVQIDPDMINALLAIGMSYKNLNDYDAAIEIFEQALGMEAGNKTALSEINQIKKLKSGSAL